MFWKVFEFLIRLVYLKRFRQAERIQKAAELAGGGKTREALELLDKIETKLHPSIGSIYWLARGRIFLAAGSLDEAEAALIRSAKADPSNAKAHLDLAVVAGRKFRFDDARARLDKLKNEAGEEEQRSAAEILELLDKVISGEREKEFIRRAEELSQRSIGPKGETPGLPANLDVLDEWIDRTPDQARALADEIALLVGHSEVAARKARWKVGLAIEDSLITMPNGVEISPFDIVSEKFSSPGASLRALFDKKAEVVKNG